MMQLLPTEIHDWVNSKEINLGNHSHDGRIRCFLGFDLGYLNKFHDLHNDYPLACEKIK